MADQRPNGHDQSSPIQEDSDLARLTEGDGITLPVYYARVVGSRIEMHLRGGNITFWPAPDHIQDLQPEPFVHLAPGLNRQRLEEIFDPPDNDFLEDEGPMTFKAAYFLHPKILDNPHLAPRDMLRPAATQLGITGAYKMTKPQLVKAIRAWVAKNKET